MATYPEIGSPTGPATAGTSADPHRTPSPDATWPQRGGTSSGMSQDGMGRTTHETSQKVADQARNVAGQVREQARTQLAGQKEKATEQLGSIEDALRQTSHSLRQNDQSPVADYMDRAAQQVGRLNGYLRNHTVNDLIDEAERYARREPALFLGAAALLGLAAARFFRASTPASHRRHAYGDAGYPMVHNTAGAQMPRVRQEPTAAFVASTSDLPVEGRYDG